MRNPDESSHIDPLEHLAQVARMELAPMTDVSVIVLRQIRVQNTVLAEKPLMWLALGSSAAAVAVAIASVPVLMTLLDPLNILFQSAPTSLL